MPKQAGVARMLEFQRERTLRALRRLDAEASDSAASAALSEAVQLVEALGFALDEALTDLRYMGGCPSCLHNRAQDRHAELAVCGKRLFFPLKGCYAWRGDKAAADMQPTGEGGDRL